MMKRWLQPFLPKKRSLHALGFLNGAQGCGVINDNLFKLLLIFFLIVHLGKEQAGKILSLAGAIYVLPFLLFSATAGKLADRFSKQKIILLLKGFELVITALAILAFSLKSVWGGYALLFLLATHSALFGPAKYGIIPELVPKERISKANSFIIGSTYLAIIVGTFLASFATQMAERRFALAISLCFIIACIGFLSALGLPPTAAGNAKERMNPFFIREILRSLSESKKREHLFIAICGSSFFFFTGAYTQLNIIPFAMDSLGLSEVAGGYLFLITALGIACGAWIVGRVSKEKVELGLSCIAGVLFTLLLLLLALSSHSLVFAVLTLFLLGISGGLFIVPLDSFIQWGSLPEMRGQMIAATNFLSFFGVFIAALLLYLFSEILHLSPPTGFFIFSLLSLGATLLLFAKLSDHFFHFLSKSWIVPKDRVAVFGRELIDKHPEAILVLQNPTTYNILIVMGLFPPLHLLMPSKEESLFYSLSPFCRSLHRLKTPLMQESLYYFIPVRETLRTSASIIAELFNPKSLFISLEIQEKQGNLTLTIRK